MAVAARELGVDLNSRDPELLQYLRDAAEKTKIALSTQESAVFSVDLRQSSSKRTLRDGAYQRTFTRLEFEELIRPLIERSLERCRSALKDAKLSPGQIDDVVLVGGSTRIPFVRQRVQELFGKTPRSEINPDEVVALGAAVQADILTSGRRDLLLLDVVPLSLGIETLGGVVDKLIHRNATVPCRATTRYTTAVDNQTAIILNIYQGERELTKDCKFLGTFKLTSIPPLPAQFAQVDVLFTVNQDGILTVTAKEQRSGVQAKVTIQAGSGLTRAEVDKLVQDSIENAEADFTNRRVIELRNKAEGDLRHCQKALHEVGTRLTAEQRHNLEQATTELNSAIAATDLQTLQYALDKFNRAAIPLAEVQMNEVVRQTLGGRDAETLDPNKI
jgi:molecular chaperone DnaK (HSP70)